MKMPHASNPAHADNLRTVRRLEAQGFQGPDASLEESLGQYGIAWRELPDEFLFVYRVRGSGKNARFDRVKFRKDVDPQREWDWVKWGDVADYVGMPVRELLKEPLPLLIQDLIGYYGTEEIIGTCYWEGFPIRGLA